MDTNHTNAPSGEQPAGTTQQPIATNAGGEQPQPSANIGSIADTIASLSPEAIGAILDGNIPAPETVAPQSGTTPEQPAAPASAPVEGEQPPPATGERNDAPRSLQRLSVKGIPPEQQILLADAIRAVKSGEAPDLQTAIRNLSGEAPPQNGEPPAAPVAGETPPEGTGTVGTGETATVESLQSRLAELREQRSQAYLDFDQAAVAEITEKIEDTLLNIHEARLAQRETQSKVVDWQQRHETAIDAVEAKYAAVLADETSPFGKLLDAMVMSARATNNPRLADPNFIMDFADELAADLRIGAGAPATRAPNPSPPPSRASRPVGSTVAPGHTQAPRYTPDQVKQLIETATFEDILAVLEPG